MVTNCERHSLTILWRIKNFSLWEKDCDGREIKSPCLTPEVYKGIKKGRVFKGRVLLVLMRTGLCHENRLLIVSLLHQGLFPIDCEISFIDSNRSPLIIGSATKWKEKILQLPISSAEKEKVVGTKSSTFVPDDAITLRCRIWKSYGEFLQVESISIQTRFIISKNSFVWPIRELSSLELKREVATITRFNFFNLTNDFLLKFSFKGESLESANACVELIPVSIRSTALRVSLRVTVSTKDERLIKSIAIVPRYECCSETKFCQPKLKIPISTIATREELLREETFLNNGVLNLLCELPFVRSTSTIDKHFYDLDNLIVWIKYPSTGLNATSTRLHVDSSYTCLQGSNFSVSFAKTLLELHGKKNQTDLALRTGKFSFNVHKSILCAKSTVFKNIFCSDIEKITPNCLDIPDLDARTLKEMLKFIYSGKVYLKWENATTLYHAANQYQVQSLRRECCSFFRSNISGRNASKVLSLAYRHDDSELKSIVYDCCSSGQSFVY